MYDIILKQLEKRGKPVDVIVAGVGFMGFGFLSSIQHVNGFRVLLVVSRRAEDTAALLNKNNYKASIAYTASAVKENSKNGIISVTDEISLIENVEADVVLEVTGTVDYGAEIALAAINSKKHLVTMNPELQATIGSHLIKRAEKQGVIVTDVVGDQPGSLSRLVSQARLMGFNVKMAGNMKRYLDVYATQKKMQPWADDKGLAVRQTTSFTDGTKQSIEMTLVANHFGMKILQRGMVGTQVTAVHEVLEKYNWDKIPSEGVVDYVIGKDLFPGIFVVVEHPDKNQEKYLKYLGLGDGPQYVLFEPYHLCHLEVGYTIAKVVLFGQETIHNSVAPKAHTISVAKRNLAVGEMLDGIGGDTTYGVIDITSQKDEILPIGLSHGAILKKAVVKDSPILLSDVILPVNPATELAGVVKVNKFDIRPFIGSRIFRGGSKKPTTQTPASKGIITNK